MKTILGLNTVQPYVFNQETILALAIFLDLAT